MEYRGNRDNRGGDRRPPRRDDGLTDEQRRAQKIEREAARQNAVGAIDKMASYVKTKRVQWFLTTSGGQKTIEALRGLQAFTIAVNMAFEAGQNYLHVLSFYATGEETLAHAVYAMAFEMGYHPPDNMAAFRPTLRSFLRSHISQGQHDQLMIIANQGWKKATSAAEYIARKQEIRQLVLECKPEQRANPAPKPAAQAQTNRKKTSDDEGLDLLGSDSGRSNGSTGTANRRPVVEDTGLDLTGGTGMSLSHEEIMNDLGIGQDEDRINLTDQFWQEAALAARLRRITEPTAAVEKAAKLAGYLEARPPMDCKDAMKYITMLKIVLPPEEGEYADPAESNDVVERPESGEEEIGIS